MMWTGFLTTCARAAGISGAATATPQPATIVRRVSIDALSAGDRARSFAMILSIPSLATAEKPAARRNHVEARSLCEPLRLVEVGIGAVDFGLGAVGIAATAQPSIARTAIETCKAQGYNISVNVLGREGQVVVAARGEGAGFNTMENSMKKAYTTRTMRRPSGEFADAVKNNPTAGALFLTNIVPARGALPIKVGDDVIGAVGVSGAPGGDKDEACAKAGIDKVAAELK